MLGALSIGVLATWFVGGWLIAPHASVVGKPPADLPVTSISLPSESGVNVAGWHIFAESSQGTVVLLHAKHGTRRSMLGRARLLYAAGYSIVMIDLQGHGESIGQQITYGHLERHDAQAAVEFARQAHPDEPVAVLGVSLGGAAALLASPLGIDALILESVFPDITDAVHNRVALNLGFLAFIPTQLLLVQLRPRLGLAVSDLRPIEYLPQVNCPILIISGIEDRRTKAAETEQMFAAAKQPKELWLVPDASHVDLHRASPEEYETRVLGFLDRHIQP